MRRIVKNFLLCMLTVMCGTLFLGMNHVEAAQQLTSSGAFKEVATLLQYNENGYYAMRSNDDCDWYKFQTPNQTGYTYLTFKNTGMNDRASITVYNIIDEKIASAEWIYRNNDVAKDLKLEPNSVYYIKIEGGTSGSTYVLDLDFNADEIPDTKEDAYSVECNKEYTWSMDGHDDYDYGTFVAKTTGKHKFMLKNTGVDAAIDLNIYNYDTDERLYSDGWIYKNTTDEVVLDLVNGQRYYFSISGNGGATGKYLLTINNQQVSSIKLSSTILKLSIGDSKQLNATIYPAGAFDRSVTFASNDNEIASIDASGMVCARNPGKTTVTCTSNDGSRKMSTCDVIVTPGKMNTPYVNRDNTTSSKISLSWNSVNNVSGYAIYAYDSKTKKYVQVKRVSNENTTTTITTVKENNKTKKLTAGKSYKFKVAGYIKVDGKIYYGKLSDAMSASSAPGKTKIVSIKSPVRNQVRLSWKKVSGASGYYIYVKNWYGEYVYSTSVNGGSNTTLNLYNYNNSASYKVCAYRTVNGTTYVGGLSTAKTVKIKK